ncbi:hypothetical protein BC332_15098 [Capsicum chinense]|nr:hypothetical protein BC332_15098 [Capsicum chinense]
MLTEEVKDDNVLNLSDNVLGIIRSKIEGEVEDDNFNDSNYNLKKYDEYYHDVVTERRGMKAKGSHQDGFRPLISLDGCWLKGTYGGNLLAVVAIDPNDCIFLIAYTMIVEAERKETWSWFLTILDMI